MNTATMQNPIFIEIPDTPLLRIDYMFGGGRWNAPHPLIPRFAFSNLKEGTTNMSGEEFARQLDQYGAILETSTNLTYSYVTLYCLQRMLPQVMPLINDMFANPAYPDEALEIALQQAKTAWQIRHQKVETCCLEETFRRLYGPNHPAGRFATEQDYDRITRDMLVDYHRSTIQPMTALVFETGEAQIPDLAAGISPNGEGKDLIGQIHSTAISTSVEAGSKAVGGEIIRVEAGDGERATVQSAVRTARLLPADLGDDEAYVRMAVVLLGGYFGSRLMSNIREDRGLTYGISASIYDVPGDKTIQISCETTTESVDEVVEQTQVELRRLIDEPVGEDELEMVKNYLRGKFMRSYERSFKLSDRLMQLYAKGSNLQESETLRQRMFEATADDIQRVCKQYFNPDDFITCVVG